MHVIRLAAPDDFAGWRDAARALVQFKAPPREVTWTLDDLGPPTRLETPPEVARTPVVVPRAFLDLAPAVFAHPSAERFALLYRLLWRLMGDPGLMTRTGDTDVARAMKLANEVRNPAAALAVGGTHALPGTAAGSRPMPSQPTVSARDQKAALRASRDGPYERGAPTTLAEVIAGVDSCRRCDLWRDATQGVPGEGPGHAKIMLVGEQPGDQEDLAGHPFVGPAGALLDRALGVAGVDRDTLFVTNAVKHFKHELRGKRRIHKSPNAGEVEACRWWLDAERRLVRPKVIVALGATAALAVFGKQMPVKANRGRSIALTEHVRGVITYHPSFLLRVPDEAAKHEAFEALVEDLKIAARAAA